MSYTTGAETETVTETDTTAPVSLFLAANEPCHLHWLVTDSTSVFSEQTRMRNMNSLLTFLLPLRRVLRSYIMTLCFALRHCTSLLTHYDWRLDTYLARYSRPS